VDVKPGVCENTGYTKINEDRNLEYEEPAG
jgi:hypothetical protein